MTLTRKIVLIQKSNCQFEVAGDVTTDDKRSLAHWLANHMRGVKIFVTSAEVQLDNMTEVVQEGKRNIPGGPTNLEIDAHGKPLNM